MHVGYESDAKDGERNKHDGYQFDCIDGGYGSDWLDQELEIAESKKAGDDELDRILGHSPCSSADGVFINSGASYMWQTMSLGHPTDGSSVGGVTATSTLTS